MCEIFSRVCHSEKKIIISFKNNVKSELLFSSTGKTSIAKAVCKCNFIEAQKHKVHEALMLRDKDSCV